MRKFLIDRVARARAAAPPEGAKLQSRPTKKPCAVHGWSDEDIENLFMAAVYNMSNKGGVSVCPACVSRVKAVLGDQISQLSGAS